MFKMESGVYTSEDWTDEEADVLRRYFTNLDGPVFALVNLPEVVKGALFARYSRSSKNLRRLFLDEFVRDLDISGDLSVDATVGLARAEELYDRVFYEYGDDSVAQLGGVHLACEQASNVLTKILERGRLMSYMEKSTRYVAYDSRLGNGRYRYYRDQEILESPLGARYVGDMDRLFDAYGEILAAMTVHFAEVFPKAPGDSDLAWRQSVRAKAYDAVRGVLPAGATSNLGVYGSGQAYEALLIRMRSDPLPESRLYAEMILTELRKVIPSWVRRVDVTDRGIAHSEYIERNAEAMGDLAEELFGSDGSDRVDTTIADAPEVRLTDFDPDGEIKVVAAMLYPYSHLGDEAILARAASMSGEERMDVVRRYVGERSNRRHRPGRAFERTDYRFEVVSDYGAFRDLQRHRLLSIEWQGLTACHGYSMPSSIADAGVRATFAEAMERSARLWDALRGDFDAKQAAYAVALAFRIRYSMQLNAREAMHVTELRTSSQGHPEYRSVCQQMHEQIASVAGHKVLAAAMSFVDSSDYSTARLERLASENRTAASRPQRAF
jgi:thymidylate synthase ThyX